MSAYEQVKEEFNSPRDFALSLVQKIKANDLAKIIEEISVAGPGFINFKLNDSYLLENLKQIIQNKNLELKNFGQGKKAIVEYSSPNIAKPFTIGHLRSTIIGDSVANLLEASGHEVFRDNHLGDWGTQFGKQIVAIKKWGNEEEISQSANPVEKLVALYVKFHEEAEKNPELEDEARAWFKKLENGDEEARALWQKCIDWSFIEFAKIYQALGVSFTENSYGESFFEEMLQPLIEELKKQGIAKTGEEGAVLIFYPNDELSPLMIAKKDGSTLYATRDLATDKWRRENPLYQNADGSAPLVINEVGGEQTFYFQQIYRAEELLGWYEKGQRVHVKHGLYRFKEGKMSTRKGNVIWLEEVLNKAKEKAMAFTKDEAIAETVSIAALKWNDLKRKSEININFDWEEIINLQGNSGPYMLYAYARAKSILRKASENETKQNESSNFEISPLEKSLLSSLDEFSKVVARSASEFSPHYLCTYLFDLAQLFNSFYNKYPILNSSLERQFRLQLVEAVSITLSKGLALLGIKTLEKM
ncbi:MAG: Arginine-tRNA ligase [Candidatus Pacebacteria bacterium GW2011_GWF1_36_5]|nr:MAG: Arginine-tRNA ligase [Candidatus Pacebacteria bacterium GW2011_GWF1_36_5]